MQPVEISNGKPTEQQVAGAQDTIYLCNFRVSVDGEWLCLKELEDVEINQPEEPFYPIYSPQSPRSPNETPAMLLGMLTRDPAAVERSNLLNISKLIVKELIETSLKYGRMLDSDHMPLQHFFIVLEHVLRHGLRPKKGLLGPKKELWDILQLVEKFAPEAQDITTSVRDLPTVRTAMGRARAWLRLALMQKKLADYLKVLTDHKDDVLRDYFEPDALIMCDEAIVIMGLLVGLNVIDCNLCVKEEDLDCPQGVIDFSLYLRSSHHCPIEHSQETAVDSHNSGNTDQQHTNMTTVLDQKNYIEELNRHLNATVTNLQAKVESLTTTNALMKEDLAISKSGLMSVVEENNRLKRELESGDPRISETIGAQKSTDEDTDVQTSDISSDIEDLKQQLLSERKEKDKTEKELKLQISLRAEMEMAVNLLEKDIHEKQDTIVSLRRQLEDIKLINLDMYKKLQECDSSLKHKTDLVSKLEAKGTEMTDTLQKVDDKYQDCLKVRFSLEQQVDQLAQDKAEVDLKVSRIQTELEVERERRIALEQSMVKDRDRIAELQRELSQLRDVSAKFVTLQEDYYRLKEQNNTHEQTLEELGTQLRVSKLQVADLQEEAKRSGAAEASWIHDKEASHCKACEKEFSITRRKHHCRNCGEIFCNACSDNTMPLPSFPKPMRVCDQCHLILVERYSVVPQT